MTQPKVQSQYGADQRPQNENNINTPRNSAKDNASTNQSERKGSIDRTEQHLDHPSSVEVDNLAERYPTDPSVNSGPDNARQAGNTGETGGYRKGSAVEEPESKPPQKS